MANIISLESILNTYGSLNDLRAPDGLSGDRRTLSTTDALSAILEKAYTADSLANKTFFSGIVMATLPSNAPTFTTVRENLEYLSSIETKTSTESTNQNFYFIYKVYVPEIDPRNILEEKSPNCMSLAQKINTLPDAVLAGGAKESNTLKAIQPGTLVDITFTNEERFLNPRIVKIGPKLFDINLDGSSIKLAHQAGTPTTLGVPLDTSTAGSPSGLTPGQKKAKNLKELRKQIFDSKGVETLKAPSGYTFSSEAARGGLDGPLKKKSNRSWESNAILDESMQRELKKKFAPELRDMLIRLGMPLVTFDRILRKESGIFDPYAINNNTSAVGLIQFMPKTAKGLGTTVEKLLTMGPKEQLTYVEKYFSNLKGSRTISSNDQGVDWYFLVFYPAAIGKDNNYEIGGNKKALAASQNPGYRDPLHPQNFITRRSVIEDWKKQV